MGPVDQLWQSKKISNTQVDILKLFWGKNALGNGDIWSMCQINLHCAGKFTSGINKMPVISILWIWFNVYEEMKQSSELSEALVYLLLILRFYQYSDNFQIIFVSEKSVCMY